MKAKIELNEDMIKRAIEFYLESRNMKPLNPVSYTHLRAHET